MDLSKLRDRRTIQLRAGINITLVTGILSVLEILVGVLANSVTVFSDGMNSLSDCVSNLITVISTLLAGKAPDALHPYGYGRMEYISGLAVACIIAGSGFNLLYESILRVFTPAATEFSIRSSLILLSSVLAKAAISVILVVEGKHISSDDMVESGKESVLDVVQSAVALACILIYRFTGRNVDAYAGIIVSAMLLVTGIKLFKAAIDALIGMTGDSALARGIYTTVLSREEIHDAYHLVLHNYGPLNHVGSMDIVMDDRLSVTDAVEVIQRTRQAVWQKYGMLLSFEIHAMNTTDPEVIAAGELISSIAMSIPGTRAVHAFDYIKNRNVIFVTALVDFSISEYRPYRKELSEKINEHFPHTTVFIRVERFYE